MSPIARKKCYWEGRRKKDGVFVADAGKAMHIEQEGRACYFPYTVVQQKKTTTGRHTL